MKRLRISVNGKQYEVEVEVLQDDEPQEGSVPRVAAPSPAPAPAMPNPFRPKPRVTIGDHKTLTSPINGVVLDVLVKEGEEVKETAVLFVLEAMKMKTNISSPQSGVVERIAVRSGDAVETGQVLLTFKEG